MSQFERLNRINSLVQERRVVPFNDLMDDLEVSRATLKRDIQFLRDRFNAPLVYDRDAGGYRYDKPNGGPRFELPGLWFTSEEILALMTMHQMLESLDTGGLLGPHVKPLMTRLTATLDSATGSAQEILKRVKLIAVQKRRVDPKYFELIGSALVKRRRLILDYYGRTKDRRTKREVSPLRLVNYRGNWYLDAWCHKSEGIRMFALDSIHSAELSQEKAKDVSLKSVDDELGGGYGIYRGKDLQWATLVFNAEAAKWVRAEIWHENQKARELEDGCYELKIPFTEPSELEMDILRHGENVEVIAPTSLRSRIGKRLSEAAGRYGGES
jgi:predicted DNA-binding transcriptional regulator YafY